jgi:superoxide dismutase, Cu-Zn family
MHPVLRWGWLAPLVLSLATALPAGAVGEVAIAKIKLADGTDAGTVSMMEATAGVLIKYDLVGLPPGPHALHVHEAGKCDGDFTSAGGVYNPLGAKHGYLNEEGPMAGDLPNIHVGADGKATGELVSPFLTLSKDAEESLFDSDGSTLILFEKQDDYASDPDGQAGNRIACGTITAK